MDIVNNDTLSKISGAARNGRIVAITYRDSKGNITIRDTEPYEIKGETYFGYCLTGGGIRGFKLNNILSAAETDKSYTPRWQVRL